MMRVALTFLFLLAFVGAQAAGYDDLSRGISANNRQDYTQAISSFSSVLATGDLNPKLVPVAYAGRGAAYLASGNCASAIPDFAAALKLKPDDWETFMYGSQAHACQNELPAAIADAAAALTIHPTEGTYFARARLRYLSRDFTGASDDLAQANKLEPRDPYVVLWQGLSQMAAGTFEARQFSHDVGQLDLESWPKPIFDLFLGDDTTEDVVNAAIRDGNTGPKCEADFYVAEWQLIWQETDAARPLLQDAVKLCPYGFIEFSASRVELARLH